MGKICPKHVELILEINKTVIVASRWFIYYLTYIDDARSNTNQVSKTDLRTQSPSVLLPHRPVFETAKRGISRETPLLTFGIIVELHLPGLIWTGIDP